MVVSDFFQNDSEVRILADFFVPVDLLHWGSAIGPIIILLFLLVWGRWGAAEAGSVT